MKPLRRIRPHADRPPPRKSETTITVEQSHARQIRDLPKNQLDMVVRSIKEGINVGRIAAHCEGQGWLTVKASTFVQYLHAFKRLDREFIENFQTDGLDDLIERDQPGFDEEQALEQLVRLQHRRLRIAHNFERQTQLLNPNLHKDIATTAETIERLAKIRSGGKAVGRPEKNPVTLSQGSRDAISGIERDEDIQRKLVNALGNLAGLVRTRDDGK